MNKLEKIGAYELETGVYVETKTLRELVKEENIQNVLKIFSLIRAEKFDELTLEDIALALSVNNINQNIKIDLTRKKLKYFVMSDNFNISKKLTINTKSLLWEISQLITHDNTIVTQQGKPISDFRELSEYLEVSYNLFLRKVSPDLKKFNIIKKEKIRGKFYLVLNPLFSMKNRNISEYMFKCFYSELKELLHPLEYLYLVKLHGLDPSQVYIGGKDEKNVVLVE